MGTPSHLGEGVGKRDMAQLIPIARNLEVYRRMAAHLAAHLVVRGYCPFAMARVVVIFVHLMIKGRYRVYPVPQHQPRGRLGVPCWPNFECILWSMVGE